MVQRRASIRRATADDVDDVRALARSLASSFEFDDEAFGTAFDRLCGRPDARVLIAVGDDGAVTGYLLGFVHDTFFANGPVAWIEEMYVADDRRRGGTGRALEADFARWAADEGATMIALATRRAAPFYFALGYEDSARYLRRTL